MFLVKVIWQRRRHPGYLQTDKERKKKVVHSGIRMFSYRNTDDDLETTHAHTNDDMQKQTNTYAHS